MEESGQGERKRASSSVHVFEVIFAVIGLGCWMAWICSWFFFSNTAAIEAAGLFSAIAVRAVFLVSFICTSAISMGISNKVNSLTKLGALWAIGFVALAAAQIVPSPIINAALCGVAAHLLLAIWFTYLYEKRTNYTIIAASIACGSLMAVSCQLLPYDLRLLTTAAFPFASLIMSSACVFSIRYRIEETLSTAKIWQLDFDLKYFAFLTTQDFIWGFAAFIICSDTVGLPLVFTVGAVGSIAALAVYLLSKNAFFTFERLLRSVGMVIIVILLSAIVITDGFTRICIAAVLFAVVMVFEALGAIRDINQGVDRPFNEIHLVAYESLFSLVFGLAGFLLAAATYSYFPMIPELEKAVPLVLLVVLVAATLYSVGNFQSPTSLEDTGDAYTAWGKRVQRLAGRYDTMHSQVQQIAEDYQLTPRQTEIFHGLSRGRNAKFFEETLFLSEGTVKTHISAIYKKLDIHSRQELISFVENYRGKDNSARSL